MNFVNEVEKAIASKGHRDVFVTSPTGSGKSAMFQIPAIYLAEKYNLLTVIISPLIGLMNDQVNGLDLRGYKYSRTVNSNISPIIKEKIYEEIANGECHILYLSPESMLSKGDFLEAIGDRNIGLFVVDEAHIVTTWGKQFRPDYWFLGNHVSKLRKLQIGKSGMSFVIATFTATAIFGGVEDMYHETVQSLNMVDPITYLGKIYRPDIKITINCNSCTHSAYF